MSYSTGCEALVLHTTHSSSISSITHSPLKPTGITSECRARGNQLSPLKRGKVKTVSAGDPLKELLLITL